MKLEEIRKEHGNNVKKLMIQYTFTVHKYIEINIVDFENSKYDDIEEYVAEQDRALVFDIDNYEDDIGPIDFFEIIDEE